MYVHSKIYEQCSLPDYEGYVLTKFYKPWCPYSIKVKDIVDEIDTKLERSSVDAVLRYVDCTKCDCNENGIITVPTLTLHKNKTEIARHRGSGTFKEYADFIVKNTEIDASVFRKNYESKPGKVADLRVVDFEKGLVGPWIVLFYQGDDKDLMKILEDVAQNYKKEVKVGRIHSKHAGDLERKYNIQAYPLLLGIYSGLVIPFMKKPDVGLINSFVETLIEPTFQPIDLVGFETAKRSLEPGEPIFIVFYSDLALANSYFRRLSHEYKFKAKIYRTNDEELFRKASIWPKSSEEGGTGYVLDEERVILAVYKQDMFHRCPHKLVALKEISEWIFLSHFPHVTRITNESFYSIFHGFNPALILLTRNEEYVGDLERVSARYHLGLPFGSIVFSTLDIDMFPLFMPSLLPKLGYPAIVVFNPQKQLFYHRKLNLKSKGFGKKVMSLISDYEKGRLDIYPPKKRILMKYVFIAGMLAAILACIKSFVSAKKAKR